jgi:hypothetical protein
MRFNGATRIKSELGDYVILIDYGQEGMSVHLQFETLEQAIEEYNSIDYTGAKAIVKVASIAGDETA